MNAKWKILDVSCYQCGLNFQIKEFNVDKPKKERYFCSRVCACKFSANVNKDDRINKIREACKTSEKVLLANQQKIGRKKKNKISFTETKCHGCDQMISHKINVVRKYHKDCWLKMSGGLRKGSSRGKSGWYNEFWCDSSYELAFVIYCLEHGKNIKRNSEGFNYILNGKSFKFYPDFIVDGVYTEIKNYHSIVTDEKIKQFPYKIEILYKQEMETDIFPYVRMKYGNNFVKLYLDYKDKIRGRKKTKLCMICSTSCEKKYCSKKCAALGRLGIKRPHNFLSFVDARIIVRSLNIASARKWNKFMQSDKRLKNIPINPAITYKNEWQDWRNWLHAPVEELVNSSHSH